MEDFEVDSYQEDEISKILKKGEILAQKYPNKFIGKDFGHNVSTPSSKDVKHVGMSDVALSVQRTRLANEQYAKWERQRNVGIANSIVPKNISKPLSQPIDTDILDPLRSANPTSILPKGNVVNNINDYKVLSTTQDPLTWESTEGVLPVGIKSVLKKQERDASIFPQRYIDEFNRKQKPINTELNSTLPLDFDINKFSYTPGSETVDFVAQSKKIDIKKQILAQQNSALDKALVHAEVEKSKEALKNMGIDVDNIAYLPQESIEKYKTFLRQKGLRDEFVDEEVNNIKEQSMINHGKRFEKNNFLDTYKKELSLNPNISEEQVKNQVFSQAHGFGMSVLSPLDKQIAALTAAKFTLVQSGKASKSDIDNIDKQIAKLGGGEEFLDFETLQPKQNPTDEDVAFTELVNKKKNIYSTVRQSEWGGLFFDAYNRLKAAEKYQQDLEQKDPSAKLNAKGGNPFGVRPTGADGEKIIFPSDYYNASSETLKNAKADFAAISKLFLTNQDPANIKKDFTYHFDMFQRELGKSLFGEEIYNKMNDYEDTHLDTDEYINRISPIVSGKVKELTPKQKEIFTTDNIREQVAAGAGGMLGLVIKMIGPNYVAKANGITQLVRVLRNGTKAQKTLGILLNAGVEEVKFASVMGKDYKPGFGAGMSLVGAFPSKYFTFGQSRLAKALEPYFNTVLQSAVYGTTGMEIGAVTERAVDAVMHDKDFITEIEKLYPDSGTVAKRLIATAAIVSLFGAFSGERVRESRKEYLKYQRVNVNKPLDITEFVVGDEKERQEFAEKVEKVHDFQEENVGNREVDEKIKYQRKRGNPKYSANIDDQYPQSKRIKTLLSKIENGEIVSEKEMFDALNELDTLYSELEFVKSKGDLSVETKEGTQEYEERIFTTEEINTKQKEILQTIDAIRKFDTKINKKAPKSSQKQLPTYTGIQNETNKVTVEENNNAHNEEVDNLKYRTQGFVHGQETPEVKPRPEVKDDIQTVLDELGLIDKRQYNTLKRIQNGTETEDAFIEEEFGGKERENLTEEEQEILESSYDGITDLYDYNEDFTLNLTTKGQRTLDKIEARLETRKGIKAGYDLFPEEFEDNVANKTIKEQETTKSTDEDIVENQEESITNKPTKPTFKSSIIESGIDKKTGDKIDIIIEDLPDGSRQSYITKNGIKPDKKYIFNYPKGTIDGEIKQLYNGYFSNNDIDWNPKPTIINNKPLTPEEQNLLELQQIYEAQAAFAEGLDGEERKEFTEQDISNLDEEDLKQIQKEFEIKSKKNPTGAFNAAHSQRENYDINESGNIVNLDNEFNKKNAASANYNKIKVGAKLQLSVQPDSDNVLIARPEFIGTKDEKRNLVKWGTYKLEIERMPISDEQKAELYANTVPMIATTSDGEFAFYIHQTAWIHENKTQPKKNSKLQIQDKKNLSELRKKVIEKKSVGATIDKVERNIYIRTANEQMFPTSSSMPDKDLIVAIANGSAFYDSKSSPIDSEISSKIKNISVPYDAATYAIVKVDNDTYGAIPLRQSKFGDIENPQSGTTQRYVYDTIKYALQLSFKPLEQINQNDVDFINNVLEFSKSSDEKDVINLSRNNKYQKIALQKFLNMFIFVRNMKNAGNMEDYFMGAGYKTPSNTFVLGVHGGDIHYGTKSSDKGVIKRLSDVDHFLSYLNGSRPNVDVYFQTNKNFLDNKNLLPIVVMKNGGVTFDKKTYKEIVKDNTHTNIMLVNVGTKQNPIYVSTLNNNISFKPDYISKSTEQENIPENVKDTTLDNPLPNNTEKQASTNDILDKYNTEEDFYMPSMDDEVRKSIEESISSTNIKGLSTSRQTELRRYLVYNIADDLFKLVDVKSHGRETMKILTDKVFNKLKASFEKDLHDIKESIASGEFAGDATKLKKAEHTQTMLDNIIKSWSVVERTTIDAIRKFSSIDVELEDGTILTPERATTDNANWSDTSLFTIDNKKSSSMHIKMFLSGLKDTYIKNGEIQDKLTFFGKPMPIGFDEAYDLVQRILADYGPDRSMSNYIQELRDNANTFPFLLQIADRLENPKIDESVKNEFFKVMSKYGVRMREVEIVEKNNHEFLHKVRDTNANSIFRTIKSQWLNAFISSDILTTDIDSKGDEIQIFDVKVYEELDKILNFKKKRELDSEGNEIISLREKANQYLNLADGKIQAQDAKPELEFNDKDYANALKILNAFGIKLSPSTWKDMIDGKYKLKSKGKPTPFYKLFINADSPFKVLVDKFASQVRLSPEMSPLAHSSVIRLAMFEGERSKSLYTNTFISAGKMIQSFANNQYLTDRLNTLKLDPNKLTELANTCFTKDALWLNKLLLKDKDGNFLKDKNGKVIIDENSNFYEIFSVFDPSLNPFKTWHKGKGSKEMDKLVELEHEIFKLSGIQEYLSAHEGYRNIRLSYPTNADRKRMKCVQVEAIKVPMDSEGNLLPEIMDLVYKHVILPEINSINNFTNVLNSDSNIKAYDSGGGSLFYFFPSLNHIKDLFIDVDGKRILNKKVLLKSGESLRKKIKEQAFSDLQRLIKQKLEKWEELGIGQTNENKVLRYMNAPFIKDYYSSNNKVKEAATDMVIQYFVGTANMFQLFSGNIAQSFKMNDKYKGDFSDDAIAAHILTTMIDGTKRLGLDVSPKEALFTKEDGNCRYVFFDDPKVDSAVLAQLQERFKDEKWIDSFGGITISDGQQFATALEHCFFLYRKGDITEKEWKLIQTKIFGVKPGEYYSLNKQLLDKILGATKDLFVENVILPDKSMEVRYSIKCSTIPLLPQLTYGLDIDKLRYAMEKTGVRRAAAISAVKSGSPMKKIKIFDDVDGGINISSKDVVKLVNDNVIALPYTGLGSQMEIPYDPTKTEIGVVTQAEKNFLTNLMNEDFQHPKTGETKKGRAIHSEYIETYGKLMHQQYSILGEEIEYSEQTGMFNYKKLQNLLEKTAKSKNWPEAEIKSINHKDFYSALPFSSAQDRYETLMNSLIQNRVIKVKMHGTSSVVATEAGFKNVHIPHADFIKTMKEKRGIAFSSSYDINKGLQPAGIREDGKWHPAQCIISWKLQDVVTGKMLEMANFVDENNMLDFSKLDPEVLRIISQRIPNQGLNSSSLVEIVGFSQKIGDVYFAVKDFVIQMGHDFDVDKLYSYINPLTVKDNKLVKYSSTTTEDIIQGTLDTYQKELEDENKKLTEDLSPEDKNNVLMKIRKLKKEIDKERSNLIKIYQSDMIDLRKAVLGNPSDNVQRFILQPLSNWMLPKLAEKLQEIENKHIRANAKSENEARYPFVSMLSDEWQKKQYIENTAGGSGVARFSTDNTFNSLCQQVEYLKMYRNLKAQEEFNIKLGGQESKGNLNNEKTLDGQYYLSEVHQGYQSVAVDDAKLKLLAPLNINDYTFSVVGFLNQLGFSTPVIAFINQPIIHDYIKNIKKLTKFDEYEDDMYQKARNLTISKYSETYDEDGGLSRSDYSADESENFLWDMIDFRDNVNSYKSKQITVNEYFNTQCALLDKFIEWDNRGQELGFVKSTLNADSSGIGGSIPEIIINKTNADKVINGETNIDNAVRLFGELDDSGNLKAQTIAGHAYNYGLKFANELWSKLFLYDKPSFKKVYEQIKNTMSFLPKSTIGQAELMTDIKNASLSYLFGSPSLWNLPNGDNVSKAKQRMLFDQYRVELSQDPSGALSERTIRDNDLNKSVAMILMDVKTFPVGKNLFLQRVNPDPGRKPKVPKGANNGDIIWNDNPSIIKYNAANREPIADDEIYSAFLGLALNEQVIKNNAGEVYYVNGEPYTTSMLFKDLIVSQYLNGAKQEAIQYLKYISPAFLHAQGIIKTLSGLDYSSDEVFGYNSKDSNIMSYITKQYAQHNPASQPKISNIKKQCKTRNADLIGKLVNFTVDKTSEFRIDEDHGTPYIAIHNSWAEKRYNLFEFEGLDSNGDFAYRQIDTLGTFGSDEYQYGVKNAKSLFYKNRAREIVSNKANQEPLPNIEKRPIVSKENQNIPLEDSKLTGKSKYDYSNKTGKEAIASVSNILEKIKSEGVSPLHQVLANNYSNGLYLLDDSFKIEEGTASRYFPVENKLVIDTENITEVGAFERMFLHEMGHVYTSLPLKYLGTPEFSKLTNPQQTALTNMNNLFHSYRDFFKNSKDKMTKARYELFNLKLDAIKESLHTSSGNKVTKELYEKIVAIEKKYINSHSLTTDEAKSLRTIKIDADEREALLNEQPTKLTVNRLYDEGDRKLFYAATNVREFVVEILSNEDLMKQAAKIEYKAPLFDDDGNLTTSTDMATKFKEFTRSIIHEFVDNNLLDAAIDEIFGFMSTPRPKDVVVQPNPIERKVNVSEPPPNVWTGLEQEEQSINKTNVPDNITYIQEDESLFGKNRNPSKAVDMDLPMSSEKDFLEKPGSQPDLKFYNTNKQALLRYSGKKSLSFKEYKEMLEHEPDKNAFFNTITRC